MSGDDTPKLRRQGSADKWLSEWLNNHKLSHLHGIISGSNLSEDLSEYNEETQNYINNKLNLRGTDLTLTSAVMRHNTTMSNET